MATVLWNIWTAEIANKSLLEEPRSRDSEEKHLLSVNILSNSQIEVGENAHSGLSKLTTDQQKVAVKQFYVETWKYLIDHLAIDNKLSIYMVWFFSASKSQMHV